MIYLLYHITPIHKGERMKMIFPWPNYNIPYSSKNLGFLPQESFPIALFIVVVAAGVGVHLQWLPCC